MDDVEHQELEAVADEPARSSLEKLDDLTGVLPHLAPDSEEGAQALQLATTLLPHVKRFLPRDPADFDTILLILARYSLLLRSDDAHQVDSLEQLLEEPDEDPEAAA